MIKLAFLANKLESGGTEVSLINLLKQLSQKDEYEITLILLKKTGIYANEVPSNVKIIEIFDDKNIKFIEKFDFYHSTLCEKIYIPIIKILRRLNYGLYKKIMLRKVKKIEEKFDVAIDFHGYGYIGTDYVINFISSNVKVTFIHDEKIDWISNVEDIFHKFDYYFCVSKSCKHILEQKYAYTNGKTLICRNIINEQKVIELSKVKCLEKFDMHIINILTIGRLEYQKGYDLLLDVAQQLKKNEISFKWYVIGTGTLKDEIQSSIKNKNLVDNVVLCGVQKNPYNYLKQSDFYVQTSRHEGYGIAIAEARILKKIIISTDIECVREQIVDGENGILATFSVDDFVKKIMKLINDNKYREQLQEKVNNQKFEDSKDMENFLIKMEEQINEKNRDSNYNARK